MDQTKMITATQFDNQLSSLTCLLNLGTDFNRYALALMCTCCASFCLALGLIFMKIANIKVEKIRGEGSQFYCQVEWLFGLALLICSLLLNLSKSQIYFKLLIAIF